MACDRFLLFSARKSHKDKRTYSCLPWTTATIYDWLQEFRIPVSSEGRPDGKTIPWDFMPEYLNRYPELLDADRWLDTPVMKSGNVKEAYNNVCQSFDALLEKYGYVREGLAYSTTHTQSSCGYMVYNGTTKECISNHTDDEPVLVFFCHLGIMLCIMSHLLNTSPVTLWQGFFTPSKLSHCSLRRRAHSRTCIFSLSDAWRHIASSLK